MIVIEQFRKWALSFPEATEKPHFEKSSFLVKKKIFATYDHAKKEACLKLSEMDQHLFSASEKEIIYPVRNKWGAQGWTIIKMDKIKAEVFLEVLKAAYCKVAPKKLSEQVSSTQSE